MTSYPGPYAWTRDEASIIKAAWSTDHGRLALQLVVERLGIIHGQSFDPNPQIAAFHEGRRYVARELMAVINQPLDKIVQEKHEPRSSRPVTATERAERAAAAEQQRGAAGAIAAARERTKQRG